MGSITETFSGGTPTAGEAKYYGGNIPFIRSGEISSDSTELFITNEGLKNSSAKMVEVGDILYALYGATSGEVSISSINGAINQAILAIRPTQNNDSYMIVQWLKKQKETIISTFLQGGQGNLSSSIVKDLLVSLPLNKDEQVKIGLFFKQLDNLITLQQCEPKYYIKEKNIMLNEITINNYFHVYYKQWITVYKEGAIRDVTMKKYLMALKWIEQLAPNLKLCEVNRITYQQLLNNYAIEHERVTTMDFHHQLKGAIMDAVDDGLIERDPTRKAIIKGKNPAPKKTKYLNQFELHMLLSSLTLTDHISFDWLILLIAKTGIRFSEALGITPNDFDFTHQLLSINKTWDYKGKGGFLPTKNRSSVRKVQIDWQTVIQFSELIKSLSANEPIFVENNIYNSTVNDLLERRCKAVNIPVITIHGLRHTHASLLLFAGVSIASVARRLGHASMTTTQKTYLHIIQELENQDLDLVMRSLSGLS